MTNRCVAHFDRNSSNRLPRVPKTTAMQNAMVAHEGNSEYRVCCSGGNASITSLTFRTARWPMKLKIPSVFQMKAMTETIQNKMLGFGVFSVFIMSLI